MDLLMIAFGLSMDAFAVSTTNGMCVSRQQTNRFFGKALSWSAMFGLFQGLMPLLGYFLGRAFSEFISSIDHWVAFVLLAFIGSKMVWEAVHRAEIRDTGFRADAGATEEHNVVACIHPFLEFCNLCIHGITSFLHSGVFLVIR